MELNLQLHLHTTESRGTRILCESIIRPRQAINILKENKIDVVAITDHNTTRACSKMRNYAKKKGILVIDGIEIDTIDGHIIGLDVDLDIEKKINRSMTAFEASDVIKDCGGEVYIPHLFDIRRKGLGCKVKEIDGIIEVFNSFNIFGFEDKYAKFAASKLNRPTAVGGDAHIAEMIPCGITVIDSELDERSILKILKRGNVKFKNCRYMTLRQIKEWSLERAFLSYGDIKKKIRHGWEVDTRYMTFANNRFLRLLERFFLELGTRRVKSKFWDFGTYLSYILLSFYQRSTKKEFNSFISTL